MVWAAILFAFVTAVVLTLVFTLGFRRAGPWNWWSFFLLIFVVAWAAALWIVPTGPVLWGIAWVPILIFGILIALLLAAATPPRRRPPPSVPPEEIPATPPPARTETTALDVFFWIVLVGFIIVIIVGYAS